MPRTTLPQFDVGDISKTLTALCASLPPDSARGRGASDSTAVRAARGGGRGRGRGRRGPPPSKLQQCITRISTPIGAHQTAPIDTTGIKSSVDELYRFSLGLSDPKTWKGGDYTKGWSADTYKGVKRLAVYATPDGKRAAFVRVPDRHATIVILTNDPNADAKRMAEQLLDAVILQH